MITPEIALVVYLVGVAIGVVVLGYRGEDRDVVFVCVVWPATLPFFAILGSVSLLYRAGEQLRRWRYQDK